MSVMGARGWLSVCLYVCVTGGVLGGTLMGNPGHGSICESNERFLSCGGCQKTCKDPAPVCTGVCRTGCYCEEGQVRNDTGYCVNLADCPSIAPAQLQSSEPRHTDLECPPDEEYRSCEPCNKTCDNPNPICPAQCARGCFCRGDLVRDMDGRCVKVEDCSNLRVKDIKNFVKPAQVPVVYQLTCGPHQVYSPCKLCERTCSSATPICKSPCSAGCFCQDGYVKGPDGQCVKLTDCPKAEISFGGAQEPAIEDCSTDEIYLSCGWCEPSCWDPKPECPLGVCTSGCLCRPPLLRHHSGHCVSEQECTPQKCADSNEEFVCRYGCEARCDARTCFSRPRRCILGCHCKLGLYRDFYGKCVSLDQCQTYDHSANRSLSNSSNMLNPAKIIFGFSRLTMSEPRELDHPKSVFGPIPKEFHSTSSTEATPTRDGDSKSIIVEEDKKPFKDIISRAMKLYNEFVGSSQYNAYNVSTNIPKEVKGLSPRGYRDDNGMFTREGFKANNVGNSQFFVSQDSKPTKEANVKNYMSDLINVMKEIMPKRQNFTIIENYPKLTIGSANV